MQFLTALYNSLWNLPWLKDARLTPKKAWGYFITFTAALTVLFFIPVAFSLPKAVRDINELLTTQAPPFQAVWTNGSLSVTGLQQPYISKNEEIVFVVDTISTTTIDLQKYLETKQQKVVLVAKDQIAMLDGATGQQETQNWQKDFNWAATKDEVAAWVSSHTTWGYIVFFSLALVVFMFVGTVLGKLWWLAVIAAIVGLLSTIMRRGWRWGDLFVVGLYGMTLPSLISYLIGLMGFQVGGLYFMALLAFMLAVAFTNDKPAAAIDFSDESDSL